MEFENDLNKKVTAFCKYGDELVERKKYNEAINQYLYALELLSESNNQWEIIAGIYATLGNTYYLKKEYEKALYYLFKPLEAKEKLDNSFILLRIGQCFSEMDSPEISKEYLLRAYMCGGKEVFAKEDPKYFQYIQRDLW